MPHEVPFNSSLMRGTHYSKTDLNLSVRFIPAHAGNTSSTRALIASVAVHPRSCGEHSFSLRSGNHFVGSSPLMRGTRQKYDDALQIWRFIPAHAGNTSLPVDMQQLKSVHPRSCGEHHCKSTQFFCNRGSSPLMRGTRFIQR